MNFCGRESIDSPASNTKPSNTKCLGHQNSMNFDSVWGTENRSLQKSFQDFCAPKILRIFERFSSVKRIHRVMDLKNDI